MSAYARFRFPYLGVVMLCVWTYASHNGHAQSLLAEYYSSEPPAIEQTSLLDSAILPSPAVSNFSREPSGRVRLREIFPLFYEDISLQDIAVEAERTRSFGSLLFFDYDAFMGAPDAGWTNNGIRVGGNFANRLGAITDRTGICTQIGTSVGVYDWAGTDYRLQHQDRAETQGFLTYGVYCKPTDGRRIVGGFVQDWSFNDTYGVFGQNPTMSQLRGQLGYAINAGNEFGLSGAVPVVSSTRTVRFFGETKWEPISRLSWYWHHKWNTSGPDTWISIGVPSHSRLNGDGSVGDYVVSAIGDCPLSDTVSLVSGISYMHPSSRPGPSGASDEMWNFSVGIAIYPGRNARSATIAGQQHMPLLPVANNGTFIVDSSKTY